MMLVSLKWGGKTMKENNIYPNWISLLQLVFLESLGNFICVEKVSSVDIPGELLVRLKRPLSSGRGSGNSRRGGRLQSAGLRERGTGGHAAAHPSPT